MFLPPPPAIDVIFELIRRKLYRYKKTFSRLSPSITTAVHAAMQLIIWIQAIKLTIIDFFKNTSLTGFKLLFYLDNSSILQILWIPFLLIGVLAAVYITGHYILFFQMNPTVTYINSFKLPVAEVPFPAVSICSANKISDQAIREYIESIYDSGPVQRYSKETIQKNIHIIGGFYDTSSLNVDTINELRTFFDQLGRVNPEFYNTTNILGLLAPKCEHLIRKCSWAGTTYPCTELFTTLGTIEGFCCVFNYYRPGERKREAAAKHLELFGADLGLKVLLNTSAADYFVTERSTVGFIVQIFNGLVFPDVLKGKLIELPISPNTDVFASITITTLSSDDRVRIYNTGQRNCYFADELPIEYGTNYSQQECLLKCKLDSMKSLCGCVPYYTPKDLIDWSQPVRYCTLSHVECLGRYKQRWSAYHPKMKLPGMEQEMEDSLECPKCLSLCSAYDYEYQLDKAAFPDNLQVDLDEFLTNETNLEESSLLRVFYDAPYAIEYRKKTVYNSYGLFGNVSGILGFTIGCSVVCIIEIVYFATIRFHYNLRKLCLVDSIEKNNEQAMEPEKI